MKFKVPPKQKVETIDNDIDLALFDITNAELNGDASIATVFRIHKETIIKALKESNNK